jgi:hypothetical protein
MSRTSGPASRLQPGNARRVPELATQIMSVLRAPFRQALRVPRSDGAVSGIPCARGKRHRRDRAPNEGGHYGRQAIVLPRLAPGQVADSTSDPPRRAVAILEVNPAVALMTSVSNPCTGTTLVLPAAITARRTLRILAARRVLARMTRRNLSWKSESSTQTTKTFCCRWRRTFSTAHWIDVLPRSSSETLAITSSSRSTKA